MVLVGCTPVLDDVLVSPTDVTGPELDPELVSLDSASAAFGPQPAAIKPQSSARDRNKPVPEKQRMVGDDE